MKILITGHTGFKGAWLSLWLHRLGHEIGGISLKPEPLSLYNLTNLQTRMSYEKFTDIAKKRSFIEVKKKFKPDVLIHLAAQPLVLQSYIKPRFTLETNVMGTFNILENFSNLEDLKSILIITSDKVYKEANSGHAFIEEDQLGGKDLYSSSKAMADLLTQSWISSFKSVPISIARAGNVIAGGDFSSNRLIPDIYRSLLTNTPIALRNPSAVRPWQHVLDCLNGYLHAIDHALNTKTSQVWNFGPPKASRRTVVEVIDNFPLDVDMKLKKVIEYNRIQETQELQLNSTKANNILLWKNIFDFYTTLQLVSEWYLGFLRGNDPTLLVEKQIDYFEQNLVKQKMGRINI